MRLEKIQQDFLWGGGNLDRNIHLVNYDIVCPSKGNDGLGIRSLSMFNRALLGKWIWRFFVEDDSTWRTVISLKYGSRVGVGSLTSQKEDMGLGFGKKSAKRLHN